MKYVVFFASLFLTAGCGEVSAPEKVKTPIALASDPFSQYAWHLINTGQTNFAQTAGTAGVDLQMQDALTDGITGKDVKILVSDDGMESEHEDLSSSFSITGNRDYTLLSPYLAAKADPKTDNDNHGTCVAGIIAATKGNEKGSQGVAPGAKLNIANFLSENVSQLEVQKLDQVSTGYDVYNQSWGYPQYELIPATDDYLDQIESNTKTGRSNRGGIFCKSAGNSYSVRFTASVRRIGNSNFDGENAHPFYMVVAALTAKGLASSYSSPGANIWISAFGGEFGDTDPAILTTDRTSCSKGYSVTASAENTFEPGGNGNTNCSYTSAFNGTSSAAPMIAGVSALLLEANPQLTWRQVKHILAATATRVEDPATSYTNPYVTSPTSHTWEQGWVTNAAGFAFHNRYGFGRVNTDAAIEMAKSSPPVLGTFQRTLNVDGTWMNTKTGLSLAIPDNSATGVTDTLNITTSLLIEAVQVAVDIQHNNIGNIGIELTSPSGTKSIVVPVNNSLEGLANYANEPLLTNAFYGESTVGNWTIKVIDGRTGTSGTLRAWKILFSGRTP